MRTTVKSSTFWIVRLLLIYHYFLTLPWADLNSHQLAAWYNNAIVQHFLLPIMQIPCKCLNQPDGKLCQNLAFACRAPFLPLSVKFIYSKMTTILRVPFSSGIPTLPCSGLKFKPLTCKQIRHNDTHERSLVCILQAQWTCIQWQVWARIHRFMLNIWSDFISNLHSEKFLRMELCNVLCSTDYFPCIFYALLLTYAESSLLT